MDKTSWSPFAKSKRLIIIADDLIKNSSDGDETLNVALRTLYYALFHGISSLIIRLYFGASYAQAPGAASPAYFETAYRCIAHTKLKEHCGKINSRNGLAFSTQNIKILSRTIVDLYTAREAADYKPNNVVDLASARSHFGAAARAIDVMEKSLTDDEVRAFVLPILHSDRK